MIKRYDVLVCGQVVGSTDSIDRAWEMADQSDDGETTGDGAPSVYDTQTSTWVRDQRPEWQRRRD